MNSLDVLGVLYGHTTYSEYAMRISDSAMREANIDSRHNLSKVLIYKLKNAGFWPEDPQTEYNNRVLYGHQLNQIDYANHINNLNTGLGCNDFILRGSAQSATFGGTGQTNFQSLNNLIQNPFSCQGMWNK